jgi:hypothetical protein
VLPEHVIDVPILPLDVAADNIVPINVGANELPELGLPLPLQPRQPDAAACRILRQLPLVHWEHLLVAADESFELCASGIGGTAWPAADMFHPCRRRHAGGTRITFS